MSESERPPARPPIPPVPNPGEAMSDEDRALEDFLARRSPVSRAYREAAEEAAPTALDARVLASAAAPVTRMRQVQRWRVPVSLAASFIVVIGVLRFAVQDNPSVPTPAVSVSTAALSAASSATESTAPAAKAERPSAVPAAAGSAAEPREASPPAPVAEASVSASVEANAEAGKNAGAARAQAEALRADEFSRRAAATTAIPESGAPSARADTATTATTAAAAAAPQPASAPASPSRSAKSAEAARATGERVAADAAASSGRAAEAGSPASDNPSAPVAPRALPPPAVQAQARADESKPASQAALPLSMRADERAGLRPEAGWRAGQYRGLPLGRATLDDVLRRFGPAPVSEPVRSAAPLPDGRARLRLLDYPDTADARGALRLYVDANSQTLASVALTLKPALPLASVERQEGLSPPGLPRAADAPLCTADPPAAQAAVFPQYRVYAGQGVYLLLSGPDTVAEISYYDQCR